MNYKRIARMLVCLVLVCALLVQASPIKVKAVAAEMALTGVAAAGAIGLLYLATAGGAVYVPEGIGTFEAVGTAFTEYMYQWGSTAEKLEECEEFFGGLTLYGGNPNDDDPDDKPDRTTKILDSIRRGAALFTAAAILAGSTIVEQKEVPTATGWSFYGEYLIPTLPEIDGYPYMVIHRYKDKQFVVTYSDKPLEWLSGAICMVHPDGNAYGYRLIIEDSVISAWDSSSSYTTPSRVEFSGSIAYTGSVFVWTNYDIFGCFDPDILYYEGSESRTTFVVETPVEPSSFVTDVKDQLSSGDLAAENLVIPDINYVNLIGEDGSLVTGITDILKRLDEGIITHEELMEIIAVSVPEPDPAPEPEPEPEPDPEPDPSTGTDDEELILGDIKTNTFFETLTDIVTAPAKWIWEKLDTKLDILKPPEFDFDKLTSIVTDPAEWIWPKIQTYFEPLLNPDVWLEPLPDVLEVPFRKTWEYIQAIPQEIADASKELATEIKAIPEKLAEVGKDIATHIQALPNHITDAATQVQAAIQHLPDYIADAAAQVEAAVESLVVPEEDYLSDKIDDLCQEFEFADSIVETAQQVGNRLVGITTTPPVIYIDLGAARGSYDFGDEVPFLDLRWYAEYKPTVDAIISGFLWACFIWRTFVKLPGIINGAAGDFVLIQSRREDYYDR